MTCYIERCPAIFRDGKSAITNCEVASSWAWYLNSNTWCTPFVEVYHPWMKWPQSLIFVLSMDEWIIWSCRLTRLIAARPTCLKVAMEVCQYNYRSPIQPYFFSHVYIKRSWSPYIGIFKRSTTYLWYHQPVRTTMDLPPDSKDGELKKIFNWSNSSVAEIKRAPNDRQEERKEIFYLSFNRSIQHSSAICWALKIYCIFYE